MPIRHEPPPQHVTHLETPTPRPPAAPAQAPAASPRALALFEGQVRQAVQRAVAYPMAARVARQTGRTQVGFTLNAGRVGAVRVLRSSGFPMLDQAALAAVRDARYPPPPAALAGRAMQFEVWVVFRVPDDD